MEKKKTGKPPAGRKPLEGMKRRCYKYYLNRDEHEKIRKRLESSPYPTLSEYVRALVLEEDKGPRHINPVSFVNNISELARQVGKLGNNINQLAHHANLLANEKKLGPELVGPLQERIDSYAILQREILEQLKSIMKG